MNAADTRTRVNQPAQTDISANAVAITGLVAMAQGVSLGRFVFTPMLPTMLNDGSVTLVQGGALATANYVGYLVGALLCLCIRADPARMMRGALVFAALLTLAMALPGNTIVWGAWRALGGICCAFVMVYGTAWSQQWLARLGRPKLAGMMFCGPGIGIVLTSLPASSMTASHWPARWGWVFFSILGALMMLPVWRFLRPPPKLASLDVGSSQATSVHPVRRKFTPETWALTIVFGLAGFGYIVIATFLPVIAHHAMPGSLWVDFFWPVFGVGVTVGAWLVTRVGMHHDNRRMLMIPYVIQAIGVGTVTIWPTVIGFLSCSVLVGTPFLAITSIAMREARRLSGVSATRSIGLMTASYATGQIAGPLLATALIARTNGFGASLGIAAAALLVGATGCFVMLHVLPSRDRFTP